MGQEHNATWVQQSWKKYPNDREYRAEQNRN
jgi:hypothetical protein